MSDPQQPSLARRLAAEAIGTAFLLISIVSTGILAQKLAGGNVAVALLGITTAVGAALAALIVMFQSISGAHFNPCVTLMVAALGDMKWKDVPAYIAVQIAGGCAGVALSNLMFEMPAVVLSTTARTGSGQWLGEFVATFGLFAAIWASARLRPTALPFVVAAYVYAAIWFTSSTCFANPAVTIARALSDTMTGIRPADVPAFLLFQLLGAGAATALFQWLIPPALIPAAPVEYQEQVVPTEPAAAAHASQGSLEPLG